MTDEARTRMDNADNDTIAAGDGRHRLCMPYVRELGTGGRFRTRAVHETGSQVICSGCGEAFILLRADRYAEILARLFAVGKGLKG